MSPDIKPEHLEIVKHILCKNLPEEAVVWVFGSRAKQAKKKYSDLDLLIDIKERLPADVVINLAEDFDESDLPYKVDIVDWNAISETFRNCIKDDRMLIHYHKQ
ncbi:nucleotidyltransferase domain-containing protein [soil metagenome]